MPLIPVALDRSERMIGAAAAVPLRAPSALPLPTENDEKEALEQSERSVAEDISVDH